MSPRELEFSAQQADAITRRQGALALAANAGSGKTSVLVERFARAVIEDGIEPSRILAITFTDRAAGELRARVRARLTAAGRREAATDAATGFISTFHAFSARILRAHPLLTGIAPDFTILDDAAAERLQREAFELALVDWLAHDGALDLGARFSDLEPSITEIYKERRSRGELVPRLPAVHYEPDEAGALIAFADARNRIALELGAATITRSVERALARLERAGAALERADGLTSADLGTLKLPRQGRALCTPAADKYEGARLDLVKVLADRDALAALPLLGELLEGFGQRFTALKAAHGGVDYDDLELRVLELLREHPEIARGWRERFAALMVDELQDANDRQMEIVGLLDNDNVFSVGDSFQAIYGFRHADVTIFRERFATLERSHQALVLSTNYRSRAPILEAVNAVFAPIFGKDFAALEPGREDALAGAPVELLLSDTDHLEDFAPEGARRLGEAALGRRAEARLLAGRIDELISVGEAAPGDVVVLLRAATFVDVYEAAIRDRGYPTLIASGAGFYARQEIADLAVYLRAVANPHDELALYGALASPLCGAGTDELVEVALAAREGGVGLGEAMALVASAAVRSFAERFAQVRLQARRLGLGELVAQAISANDYELYLAQLQSPERRIANVRKLVRLAREFERREGRDLRRFVDALSVERIAGLREAEAPPPVGDAVRLMTIHAAKGLEFPLVAVADLAHQRRSDHPRLLADGERVGLLLPSLERESEKTLDYLTLEQGRRAAELEEERRVHYVAMTRARERLILSAAVGFAKPPPRASAAAWLLPALVEDLGSRMAAPPPPGELVGGTGGVPVRLTLARPGDDTYSLAPASPLPLAEPVTPRRWQPIPRLGALEAKVSYTALAEYERCGYRYYLERVLGLPEVDSGGGAGEGRGAADRGVLVHALLEEIDFGAPGAPDAQRIATAARERGIDLTGEGALEVAGLVGAIAHSPLCARLAGAQGLERERSFAFLLDGELVRGLIDAVGVEGDGTLLIVDYKTDRVAEGEDLEAQVKRDYSLQRLVYALAALRSGAGRVEVAHCFLRAPARVASAGYAPSQRAALEEELCRRLAPLRAGRFEVTERPGFERCATCPGRARLCSYDESLTLRAALF